jgi:TPR repeat protein
MFALGAMHGNGHGLPRDRRTAQEWFRAAAERGHGHAQLMLGRYLASGAAGKPAPEEARQWLERAVAQGILDAQADLADLATPVRSVEAEVTAAVTEDTGMLISNRASLPNA